MNDGKLSQDEIDALLNISTEPTVEEENAKEPYLTDLEIDTVGEIGNISFGSSATTLSTLLDQKVEITTPSVSVLTQEDLEKEFTFEPVSIQVDYTKGFSGRNVLVIKATDAAIIADIMLGGDGTNPDKSLPELHISAVQEVMNQMMGAAATSMSTVFDKQIDISPPKVIEGSTDSDIKALFDERVYVKLFFRFIVGDLIDSNMTQLMPLSFAKDIVNQLMEESHSETAAVEESVITEERPSHPRPQGYERPRQEKVNIDPVIQTEPEGIQPAASPRHDERSGNQYLGHTLEGQDAPVQQASFTEFEPPSLSKTEQTNLDMLLDIPLKITVELGKTKKSIEEILELSHGSIIELDKLAGEPVDVLVNGKLIAQGEVVVIEENFGVRVTDVVSQTDRIMKLK